MAVVQFIPLPLTLAERHARLIAQLQKLAAEMRVEAQTSGRLGEEGEDASMWQLLADVERMHAARLSIIVDTYR